MYDISGKRYVGNSTLNIYFSFSYTYFYNKYKWINSICIICLGGLVSPQNITVFVSCLLISCL